MNSLHWCATGCAEPRSPQANVQTAPMEQPNQQQLRSLRLTALARDNQVVADLNASIAETPDSLVKELMDTHGWPAHEALSAVQQLQEKALKDTSEQAAA